VKAASYLIQENKQRQEEYCVAKLSFVQSDMLDEQR